MAVPTSFDESNAVFGAPKVMGEECEALSVLVTNMPDTGTPAIVSCWKLTAEELAEINRTGRVWLCVAGHTMMPVFITGEKPF